MSSNDLPIKKIYIDSKFKRHDSVSNSNFKIELPYTLKMGDNTVFYVDDVCVPHTWHTVEEGVNDKIYIRTILNGANTDYLLALTAQNYNGVQLRAELETQIQTLMFLGSALVPTVLFNSQTNEISVSIAGHNCKILTDTELKTITNWGGTSYDINSLDSVNELLTNTAKVSTIGTPSSPVKFYLNLQPVRNIYMRSPNISSFSTIGCNGESSIIKKIPVSSNFGDMIFNNITSANDFLDCSKQTWKTLEFHLLDVNSKYINLHGSNVSFSLILDKQLTTQ
tara:strand:+ start:161 stop:1003 length:843 start_codon:yes stop_codon:yes gene_type:complete